MRPINQIIVHCSWTTSSQDIGAKEIKKWHTSKPRFWSDIGYHFVIRRNGFVELGRPLHLAGAHCLGHNENSIGVCWIGGAAMATEFNERVLVPENNILDVQYRQLHRVVRAIRILFDCPEVYGHNEKKGHEGRNCPVIDMKQFRREMHQFEQASGTALVHSIKHPGVPY